MKLKALVAAVALVAAGAANAAITPDQTGGSSLVFEAWDDVSGQGYVKNLGKTFNQFLTTNSATFTNAISASDLATLLGSDTSGASLNWHIFSVKTNPDLTSADGVLTTIAPGGAPSAILDNFSIGTLEIATASHIFNDILAVVGTADSAIISSSSPAYGGLFGTDNSGNLFGQSAIAGFGTMDFYQLDNNQDTGTLLQVVQPLTFTLSAIGDITYGGAPAAVPLPAAAWLFGSGVLGLVGIARRRLAVV